MSPLYEVLPISDFSQTSISGEIESRFFGSALIGRSKYDSHRCLRSKRLVKDSGLDQILLQVIITGNFFGSFDDQEVTANAGDTVIIDYAKPFDILVSDGQTYSFAFDRALLSKIVSPQSLHGAVVRGDTALGMMLSSMISTSLNIATTKVGTEPNSLEAEVVEFIGKSIIQQNKVIIISNDIQKQAIIDFIDQNISNPNLDPNLILDKFNLSRAYLYRMFDDYGGISKLIWDRRLKSAYLELSNMSEDDKLSIKAIAYKYGCADPTQFSKRFSKKYSLAPKDALGVGLRFRELTGSLFDIQRHFSKIENGS